MDSAKETGFLSNLWAETNYSRKKPGFWPLSTPPKKPGFYRICVLRQIILVKNPVSGHY